jgi:hypothetical protein
MLIGKNVVDQCWKFIAAAKQARKQALAQRDIGDTVPRLGGNMAPLPVTDWYGTYGERPEGCAQVRHALISLLYMEPSTFLNSMLYVIQAGCRWYYNA